LASRTGFAFLIYFLIIPDMAQDRNPTMQMQALVSKKRTGFSRSSSHQRRGIFPFSEGR
jgi:hypothetical protein